jgi:hypothetical protein
MAPRRDPLDLLLALLQTTVSCLAHYGLALIAICILAEIGVFSARLAVPAETTWEIDVNSGRQRTVHRAGWFELYRRNLDPDYLGGTYARYCGRPAAAPQWRTYRRQGDPCFGIALPPGAGDYEHEFGRHFNVLLEFSYPHSRVVLLPYKLTPEARSAVMREVLALVRAGRGSHDLALYGELLEEYDHALGRTLQAADIRNLDELRSLKQADWAAVRNPQPEEPWYAEWLTAARQDIEATPLRLSGGLEQWGGPTGPP